MTHSNVTFSDHALSTSLYPNSAFLMMDGMYGIAVCTCNYVFSTRKQHLSNLLLRFFFCFVLFFKFNFLLFFIGFHIMHLNRTC